MTHYFNRLYCRFFRKENTSLLAFYYLFGFALGLSFSFFSGVTSSLMHSFSDYAVSIVWFLIHLLLPFLFSVFAVCISAPELLYCICMLKAFLLSYLSVFLMIVYSNYGFLKRTLILFSDYISIPVLFFFWYRHISGITELNTSEIVFFLLILIGIGVLDYYFISRFL